MLRHRIGRVGRHIADGYSQLVGSGKLHLIEAGSHQTDIFQIRTAFHYLTGNARFVAYHRVGIRYQSGGILSAGLAVYF